MKGTKDLKEKRGITLIALIITVIVMLILIAVTISVAVSGNLENYARKAGKETNEAIDAEQQLANGKVKIDGKWYDSIEGYILETQMNSNAKYFEFTFNDSYGYHGIEKAAVITGIKEEYMPRVENKNTGALEPKPLYIQDGDKKITDIVIPGKVVNDGKIYTVITINDWGFGNSEITSVVIPDTIKYISWAAFAGCKKLTNIIIPSSVIRLGGESTFAHSRIN